MTLSIVFFILFALGLFASLCLNRLRKKWLLVIVEGESMLPTLHPGERIVMQKCYQASDLKVGQIVLIDLSKMPDFKTNETYERFNHRRDYYIIKRLVGLPGNTVKLPPSSERDIEGKVWHVTLGSCLILSDNLAAKGDSRYFGLLPLQAIVGITSLKSADNSYIKR